MSIGSKRQGKAQPQGCWIRKEKRLALYLRDGFCCQYCGRDLHTAAPDGITLDHLTPRSLGGGNEPHNLVTACRSCNSARGAKPWDQYATGGAQERIIYTVAKFVDVSLAKAIIEGAVNEQVEAAR